MADIYVRCIDIIILFGFNVFTIYLDDTCKKYDKQHFLVYASNSIISIFLVSICIELSPPYNNFRLFFSIIQESHCWVLANDRISIAEEIIIKVAKFNGMEPPSFFKIRPTFVTVRL